MAVEKRILFFRRAQTVPSGEIADFEVVSRTIAGLVNGCQSCHAIVFKTSAGKRIELAGNIQSKLEAQWLARQMEDAALS